ncbi:MAG: nucleotidyltransferase domain-containing protein [Clostridium butyricum]|nr:nucleotidyltransferase domain-containing protein [Clostridium butyricum]
MLQSILNYQKASEKLITILKTNKKVLTVFAFGSIVNGDLWEESDIDIFVVYKDNFQEIRDVYSEILDIPIHMKILNKEKFLELYKTNGKKGIIRNLLVSSKMIISKDEEIENIYNKAKYTLDKHIGLYNLVYLGTLIKNLRVSKKYLHNDSIYTSYEVLIRALDSFSKLYLNLNGYTVSKDAVKMTMNLNNQFNILVKNLFDKGELKENINETIQYVENFLDVNINVAAKLILEYLNERKDFVSSYEIKNDEKFKDFNIKIEDILKELYKRNIIVKKSRKLDLQQREKLINENVYASRR